MNAKWLFFVLFIIISIWLRVHNTPGSLPDTFHALKAWPSTASGGKQTQEALYKILGLVQCAQTQAEWLQMLKKWHPFANKVKQNKAKRKVSFGNLRVSFSYSLKECDPATLMHFPHSFFSLWSHRNNRTFCSYLLICSYPPQGLCLPIRLHVFNKILVG